jgi:hypothetical protein
MHESARGGSGNLSHLIRRFLCDRACLPMRANMLTSASMVNFSTLWLTTSDTRDASREVLPERHLAPEC